MLGNVVANRVAAWGPSLKVREPLCTTSLFVGSKCRACVDACSVQAIRRERGEWRISPACDACGACVGACPTGALDLTAPNSVDLEKETRKRLAAAPGGDIAFACERTKLTQAIPIPCAARLDEALLVSAVLQGARTVRIVVGDCRNCDRRERFQRVFGGVVRVAREILGACGVERERVWIGKAESVDRAPSDKPGSSRRHFFRQLAATVVSPQGKVSKNEPAVARRLRLIQALRESGRVPRPCPVPLANVAISDDCLGCNVCAHVCAPGAITREEAKDGRVTLKFDPGLCVNCGACAEACMPKAITLSPATDLAAPPRTLAKLTQRDCSLCGVAFHSSKTDVCPRCKRFSGNGHS